MESDKAEQIKQEGNKLFKQGKYRNKMGKWFVAVKKMQKNMFALFASYIIILFANKFINCGL